MPKQIPPESGEEGGQPQTGPEDVLGDDAAQVGLGQYGVAEEPAQFRETDLSQGPQNRDQASRDAARDDEVRKTGEDLGGSA
jgi:hypothetical protein